MPVTDPSALRELLRSVRGFILDADGVLFLKGERIPGSLEAVATLEARGIPYRVVTNFSTAHRTTLARNLAARGTVVDPERIVTGASAAAAHTARHFPGRPILVLAAPDALREFDGQQLVPIADAATAAPGGVAAVVIGDAGDDLSYRNLDVAFGHIHAGAAFIGMHRNPWWVTAKGPTLDAGALVAGLEYATGVRATITGKPAPEVFRIALAGLRRDLGRRLPAAAVAMVGDDLEADIRAAQRVGLKGILVLTGKVSAGRLDSLPMSGRRRPPDAVAPSLADVVAALD